ERRARGADRLGVGHPLLDLRIGERGTGTDGPVVHERAAGDDDLAARDGNVGVPEAPVFAAVADAQLGDLARAARGGILVTLAAGLGVVERTQPVVDGFDFVEAVLIRMMGGVVHHAVAEVVESGGCLGLLRDGADERRQSSGCDRGPQGVLDQAASFGLGAHNITRRRVLHNLVHISPTGCPHAVQNTSGPAAREITHDAREPDPTSYRSATTIGSVIEQQWARVKGAATGGSGLRRGAWYRVVRLSSREAVVAVEAQEVRLPRCRLEYASARPNTRPRISSVTTPSSASASPGWPASPDRCVAAPL